MQQIQDTSTLPTKPKLEPKKFDDSLADPVTWRELLPNFMALGIFLIALASEWFFGNFFMIVWVPYVIMPVLDYLLPLDNDNLPPERVRLVEKDKRFLIPLYLVWVVDIGILFRMLWGINQGTIGATYGSFILYAVCGAQAGGLNAVVGHELIHRKNMVHKVAGTISYAKMLYGHFFIQHIRSHHKKVATPEDPSTARFGESLYQFYWRAIPEGYVEVWDYEVNRLTQQGCSKWWQYLIYNRLVTFNLAQAAYMGVVYLVFGSRATVFHLLYSILVTLMFECVNYIEHYGLERKKLPGSDNVYESVKIIHSWNAPQVMTNYVLFKLQRHSDHHANAYKPYQILDSFLESPMLPYGYSISLLLAFFPPVWKFVIDPSAIATNKGEKVPDEVKKGTDKAVLATLCCVSVVLTYINFFVVGFTPKW